jgi:hypothetical protein
MTTAPHAERLPIVDRALTACEADGTSYPMHIRLWAPARSDAAPSSCLLEIDHLFTPPKPVHGEDAWQALQLALQLAATLLEHFESQGGTLHWPPDGNGGKPSRFPARDLLPRLGP